MRVGVDASNLRAGGGVTHLAALLRAATPADAGVSEVTVWGGASTLGQLAPAPWLRLVHEPALDGSLLRRQGWQRFRLQARAEVACDLLFAPGGSYGGTFRPFVTMSRNLLPFEPGERQRYGRSPMRGKLALLRRAQANAMRRADGVIFLNEYARTLVCDIIKPPRGAVCVIPHGVDPRFREAPRSARLLEACSTADPLRVLYVSTIDLYKHQWHVVEAVGRVRAAGVPISLELIGSAYPPARTRLEAAVQRVDPAGTFVRYRGQISHQALPDAYRRAEMFVFASSCENMPNILIEAMSAGLPIACARRGPMPEVLGDAGVYFDPEDPAAIADALLHLCRNASVRDELAASAHQRSLGYSWEACARRTFGFLASVHAMSDRRVPMPARAGGQGRRGPASPEPASPGPMTPRR